MRLKPELLPHLKKFSERKLRDFAISEFQKNGLENSTATKTKSTTKTGSSKPTETTKNARR